MSGRLGLKTPTHAKLYRSFNKVGPVKAVVEVGAIDTQTQNAPYSVDVEISAVDSAMATLANATITGHLLDVTDRAKLLAYAEAVDSAARSLTSAAERLREQAAMLRAAGRLAYHRAPLPKPKARTRRR